MQIIEVEIDQAGYVRALKPSETVTKARPAHVPLAAILRAMPRDLRILLSAEIFIRWGDWLVRSFPGLYVYSFLTAEQGWAAPRAVVMVGALIAITNLTALATCIPVAKWADRAPSPKPFIGLTFLLVAAVAISGLREIGALARKALISGGFEPAVRARAVGLYWGLRSFAYCPAPLIAALLWGSIGPGRSFLIGGGIGLAGTIGYAVAGRRS